MNRLKPYDQTGQPLTTPARPSMAVFSQPIVPWISGRRLEGKIVRVAVRTAAAVIGVLIGANSAAAQPVRAQASHRVQVQYEYDLASYEADPKTAVKRLTGITWLDRTGKAVERIDLEENNGRPRHIRNVFTYDRAGRKTAHFEYSSEVLPQGSQFSISRGRTGIKLLPALPDSLRVLTLFENDHRGNILEMRKTDGDGTLLNKISYRYDAEGRQVQYLNQDGGGKTLCESTSIYTRNGRMQEQLFRECEMNTVRRNIYHTDTAGRPIREEQYSPSMGDVRKLVMTSLSVSSYVGKDRTLDWTIWNADGKPDQRLIIVDRGDEAISRKEFVTADGSQSAGDCREATAKCGWIPNKEEFREYLYDKAGNLVREAARTRRPGEPLRLTYLVEHVVY